MKLNLLPEGVKFPGTRLTPIHRLPPAKEKRNLIYRCICDCGVVRDITASNIRRGKTRSCGCYKDEATSARSKTHGISKRAEYFAAHNAYTRCSDPNHEEFENYGARGIGFGFPGPLEMAKWLIDNLPRPSKGFILDRIDNDSGYFPVNLRWVTNRQSQRNRRVNHRITVDGVTKPLIEWAEYYGLTPQCIHHRIKHFPRSLWFFKGKLTPRVLAKQAA